MAWTTALVLLLGIAAYGVAGDSIYTELGNFVKAHSDPDVAPQVNVNTPVDVHFVYSIMNIADADKKHNTVTGETYVRSFWNTHITWNPAEYGGIDMITLPAKYFWIPRKQPIHSAVQMNDLSPEMVQLKSDGTVYYNQFYKVELLCDVSHVETGASCNNKNALWGYSKDTVNIADITGDTTGAIPYFAGSKYEITGFQMQYVDLEFDGKTYQIIDSVMDFKEKPHDNSGQTSLHFEFH